MDTRASAIEAIGNTPLIRLKAHPSEPAVKSSAKPNS